jgi:hypothetical protein
MNILAHQPEPIATMTIYQQPGDLILGVFENDLAVEPLILEQAVVQHGPVTARFQIIGESHITRIERDEQVWFHETLSCLPLHAHECQHWHSFIDRRDHWHEQGTYRVRVRFQRDRLPPRRTNGRSSIQVHFPPVFGQVPITRIEWQVSQGCLTWWTLHTYPEAMQTTYVESESVLVW